MASWSGPVCLTDLADRPDGHLGRQSEPLADVAVDEPLKPDLVSRPFSEGGLGYGIAGGVEPLQRLQERGGLVRRRPELDHEGQVHVINIAQEHQWKEGSRPSSPRLKAGLPGGDFGEDIDAQADARWVVACE